MRIYFRPVPGRYSSPEFMRHIGGDPIYREWPVLPPEGAHLEFDIGEEEMLAGNVRGYTFSDAGPGDSEPLIEVRFS